jgi:pilus assembly protein CpaF
MENEVISMHEIFSFVRRGVGPNGKVVGTFRPSGIRPKFMEKLRVAGIVLPPQLFETTTEVD